MYSTQEAIYSKPEQKPNPTYELNAWPASPLASNQYYTMALIVEPTQLVLLGAHPSTMSSYILNPNLLLLCQHKYVVTSVNLIEKNESYCWLQVEQTAMISWVILLLLMMTSALTVKKSYRWEINSRSQTEVLWCRAFMENACGKSCLALNETSCPAPSHMSNLWNPTDENASKRMKYQNGKVIFGK